MLGGLSTPREPAEIAGDNTSRKVITRNGRDVTYAFESGARIVAEHVAYDDVRVAILKNGSPSCGSSFVYDGTFSKRSLPGEGITTALLRSRGVVVFSEDQIDAAADFVDELERGS
jgi:uncharacterized protein YbbK (DUF523 family)